MSVLDESPIESIRKRPAMYIGSTDFFGHIHYFVEAVNLCLANQPSYLNVSNTDGPMVIESDAACPFEFEDDGSIYPFECMRMRDIGNGYKADGVVLAALSSKLLVNAISNGQRWEIEYRCGNRVNVQTQAAADEPNHLNLSFSPDFEIFQAIAFSNYNYHSYFNRISFLNPGVRFTTNIDGERKEYFSEHGIRDLFELVAAPYQLLHEPIHFRVREDDLDLEVIFAFQSWKNDVWHSFVNRGRVIGGGTHERGLKAALNKLKNMLNSKRRSVHEIGGTVGILSLHYPHVVWEGCIKERIGDPELTKIVKRIIGTETEKWLDRHPVVAAEINQTRIFNFPDIWLQ